MLSTSINIQWRSIKPPLFGSYRFDIMTDEALNLLSKILQLWLLSGLVRKTIRYNDHNYELFFTTDVRGNKREHRRAFLHYAQLGGPESEPPRVHFPAIPVASPLGAFMRSHHMLFSIPTRVCTCTRIAYRKLILLYAFKHISTLNEPTEWPWLIMRTLGTISTLS